MSEPVRHHTVPKFYLKRFAKDGHIELVERDDMSGPASKRGVRRALVEDHFYSFETDQGLDTSVEKMLATHVEEPGADAIRRLVERGRPLASPDIRAKLSLFMAMQRVRGPAVREMLVEQFKATARQLVTIAPPSEYVRMARLRGEDMTEEEAADAIDFAKNGAYTIEVERPANLHLGTAMQNATAIAPMFEARIWRLFEFKDPVLVTSDEPVAFVGPDQNVPGDAGGLARAHAVLFTLDPRHALLMIRPDLRAEQERRLASAADARTINLHVAFGAHRQIVRYPGTDPLAGITLPKRAPSVVVFDDIVMVQQNATEEARAKFLARVARGEVAFRRAPDDKRGDEAA
jgi:hypothetical protein